MRWLYVLVLCCLPLLVAADVATVEIGGAEVWGGMPEDDARAQYPHAYCKEDVPGLTDCLVDDGEITFENGQVRRATRNWSSSNDFETYELVTLLSGILTQVTSGKDTCATIYTYSQSEPAPNSDTIVIVLPDRFVELTATQVGEKRGVTVRESTRVNPVPANYKVQQDTRGAGACAYVE